MKRCLFFFFIFLGLNIYGEDVSLRIKALGEDFVGIIEDTETDILFDPARLNELDKKTIFSIFHYDPGYFYPKREDEIYENPFLKTTKISYKIPAKGNSLYLGGFFPKALPRTGIGFFVGGSVYEYFSSQPQGEYIDYRYWSDEIYKSEQWSTYKNSADHYYFKIFNSFELIPNATVGISYTYNTCSNEYKRDRGSERWRYNISSLDTTYKSTYDWQDCFKDTSKAHLFKISLLFNLNERSKIDLISSYTLLKDGSEDLYTRLDNQFSRREHSDTNYYDLDEHSMNSERADDETQGSELKVWRFGIRFVKKVGEFDQIRLLSFFESGNGTISEKDKTDEIYDWSHYSIHISDGDTTTLGDTASADTRDVSTGSGDRRYIWGQLGVGWQKRTNDNFSLMIGLKSSFSKDNQEETIVDSFACTSDTTSYSTTSTYEEETESRAIFLSLPIGIEYEAHPKITIRFGVNPNFFHEEKKIDGEKEYNKKLGVDYSAGIGFKLSDRFFFDIYIPYSLGSFKQWEVGGKFCF